MPTTAPAVVAADDAPAFWQLGILWNVPLSADTTAGQLSLLDQTMPRGSGPPSHVHERYDEGFFVISGRIRYVVGDSDDELVADEGAAVWIPRGTRHSFEVLSETCRVLNFYTPGGFDESVSLRAAPAQTRTLPPSGTQEADAHRPPMVPEREQGFRDRIAQLHSQTLV
jgi:mannose-6-phosphate isomerase-like protein (cupin superfamily)